MHNAFVAHAKRRNDYATGRETSACVLHHYHPCMVNIEIRGPEDSRDYDAAVELKGLIERDFRPQENGHIIIVPNVLLFGEKRREIDLLVFGTFRGSLAREVTTRRRLSQDSLSDPIHAYVNFLNFCVCIEVKDHPEVLFEGGKALVRYRGKKHDASSQSFEQPHALKSYLRREYSWSPFICNLLWFRNLTQADLRDQHDQNFLPGQFDLTTLLQLICHQRFPYYESRFDCWTVSCADARELSEAEAEFDRAVRRAQERPTVVGRLTREKLERITRRLLKDQEYAQSIGQKLVVLEGRAGTGKTIKLLHIARDLCVDRGYRCLLLTYNRALVADMLRLIALAQIDSDIAAPTVEVTTVHSFVRRLLVGFGLLDSSDDTFIERYQELKRELIGSISAGLVTRADIQDLMTRNHEEVAWDAILIDEAQDWPEDEKELLFQLFGSEKCVVADGVDQLVRTQRRTDWKRDVDYSRTVEKVVLRQKTNLYRFRKAHAESLRLGWDLKPKADFPGGKVVVTTGGYNKRLHEMLDSECRAAGNLPYEMLFMAPPALVGWEDTESGRQRRFRLARDWEAMGIKLWDGTGDDLRSVDPRDPDSCRLVQYDSCRGLEGWTAVCLWLDELYEYKRMTLDQKEAEQMALGLRSQEEIREELAWRWTLIPMSRAVDTLVITLRHPDSTFGRHLRALTEKHEDCVHWYD